MKIELMLYIICSTIQIIGCLLFLRKEENKETFKLLITLLILGFIPISIFIIIGLSLIFIASGIIYLFEYIGDILYDKFKK